jgi:hypothetical protein
MAAAVRDGALSFTYLDASAFDRFAGLSGTTFQQLSRGQSRRGCPPSGGRLLAKQVDVENLLDHWLEGGLTHSSVAS